MKNIFNFIALAIVLGFVFGCKSRKNNDTNACNCSLGNDSLQLDSIIVYEYYRFGALAMGKSNAVGIKNEGKKYRFSDSLFLNASRSIFMQDCQFSKYLQRQNELDVYFNLNDDQGAYGQLIEIYCEYRKSKRQIQMMCKGPGCHYVYVADKSKGNCTHMMNAFVSLFFRTNGREK